MWYHGDDREYLCVGTLGDDGQVEVEVVHGFFPQRLQRWCKYPHLWYGLWSEAI